jgi:hypothetical protein
MRKDEAMKILHISLILIGLLTVSVRANEADFLRAQEAYDDGRYAEAVLIYDAMLSNGVSNTEVHYNLANACFKDSDLPKAVWHYRTAWYRAPRDPDIIANMNFALNAAGAIAPQPTLVERIFFTLGFGEWIALGLVAYVLLTLLLMLALFLRTPRRTLLKFCLIPLVGVLAAAGGWWHWQQLKLNPEAVVIASGTTALFGPMDGSTAHYTPPLGALTRQRSTDAKGWTEIEYDGKRGWVRNEHIRPVSP